MLDVHLSIIQGSINAIQKRIVVSNDDFGCSRKLIQTITNENESQEEDKEYGYERDWYHNSWESERSEGEIIDESEDLSKSINKIDDNTISIHGDTEIEKIEEYFKIKLTGVKEITNINGLLHNILKDLPKQGDKVEFQNLILEVKELRDNRPNKVIIKKK